MSYKLGEVFVELPMISRSRCVPDKFVSNEELCIYKHKKPTGLCCSQVNKRKNTHVCEASISCIYLNFFPQLHIHSFGNPCDPCLLLTEHVYLYVSVNLN